MRYSSKSHTQFTDEVRLRPLDYGTQAYEVDARKSSEVFDFPPNLGNGKPMSPHHIKKTVEVDLSSV